MPNLYRNLPDCDYEGCDGPGVFVTLDKGQFCETHAGFVPSMFISIEEAKKLFPEKSSAYIDESFFSWPFGGFLQLPPLTVRLLDGKDTD